MRLHVELTKNITRRKAYKPFALWLALRHLRPEGRFRAARRDLEDVQGLLGCSYKTLVRHLRFAIGEGFIRGACRNRYYYLSSYLQCARKYGLKTKTAFEFDMGQIRHIKEVFFAVNAEHLIRWRREHWRGLGNHGASQSTQQGNDLFYGPAMLSVRYLAKMFGVSLPTIAARKDKAKVMGLLTVRHTRIPLAGDMKTIQGLGLTAPWGHKIIYDRRYWVNHCDSIEFRRNRKFFSWRI
ncbi:MAG: hypothetical protein KDC99_19475 [Cyclobacteriaceae bacterium]|nr:hypothetical protein [Cyclobacteriaceae bacterium]